MTVQATGDLQRARRLLAHLQREQALQAGLDPSHEETGSSALELVRQRRAGMQDEGTTVWDSVTTFRLRKDIEDRRTRLAEQVIERVKPSRYEEPAELAALAREVATVELLIAGQYSPEVLEAARRVVLGTTADPLGHAAVHVVGESAVVRVPRGTVGFLLAAAEAVVTSWQIDEQSPGRTVFSSSFEATVATLSHDSRPIQWLADVIGAWLVTGAIPSTPSPARTHAHEGMLAFQSQYVRRFLIAHEYAHVLMDYLGVLSARLPRSADRRWLRRPQPTEDQQRRELRADAFAVDVVMRSAVAFDDVAPNMALQGAGLAMGGGDLVRQLRVLVASLHDEVAPPPWPTHPPYRDRGKRLFRLYEKDYARRRQWQRQHLTLELKPALVPGQTLDLLWSRAGTDVSRLLASGVPLHPVWTSA